MVALSSLRLWLVGLGALSLCCIGLLVSGVVPELSGLVLFPMQALVILIIGWTIRRARTAGSVDQDSMTTRLWVVMLVAAGLGVAAIYSGFASNMSLPGAPSYSRLSAHVVGERCLASFDRGPSIEKPMELCQRFSRNLSLVFAGFWTVACCLALWGTTVTRRFSKSSGASDQQGVDPS